VPYSSPFKSFHALAGAVGSLGDVTVILRSRNPSEEHQWLRNRRGGLIDLSWRGVFELGGRDRARFLHGMCTNDIKGLRPGQGCMAAIVNRQGKMVSEIVVRARQDSLLVEVDRSNLEPTIGALQKFLVADDVSIRPTDMAILGFYGQVPSALPWPELPAFGFQEDEDGVITSRHPVFGYDLLFPASKAGEWGGRAYTAGFPIGLEAYEAYRIELGFPRWGADMGPDLLPMEAGLEPLAISYTKGCYIGQEVIQRVKTYSEPPRMLVQLAFEGKPAAGARVLAEGAEVGTVTSVGDGLALAIVRKEQKAPGTQVQIEPGVAATVRALPWQAAL
jgi:folate-binding protein YgfZ